MIIVKDAPHDGLILRFDPSALLFLTQADAVTGLWASTPLFSLYIFCEHTTFDLEDALRHAFAFGTGFFGKRRTIHGFWRGECGLLFYILLVFVRGWLVVCGLNVTIFVRVNLEFKNV